MQTVNRRIDCNGEAGREEEEEEEEASSIELRRQLFGIGRESPPRFSSIERDSKRRSDQPILLIARA